jgi:hypothetical protein
VVRRPLARCAAVSVRVRLGRVAWTLGAVILALALAYGCLMLGVAALGNLGCEHESRDSNFGEFSWQRWPPGWRCTYNEETNGVDEIDDTGWVPTVYVLGLTAGGAVLVATCRRLWQRDDRPPPDAATLTRRLLGER